MTLLNPCPDCKWQKEFDNRPLIKMKEGDVYVQCFLCGKRTSSCVDFEDAAKEWNEFELP